MTQIHSLLPSARGMLLAALAVLFLAACQTLPSGLTASQIETLQNNGFVQTDEGWELSIAEKVLFGFDQDQVSSDSSQYLEHLSRALQSSDLTSIRIDGHTDNTGPASYNKALSRRRADAVADIISAAGMPDENILVRGLGSSKPVADNSTREGRSENRRVSIIISVP